MNNRAWLVCLCALACSACSFRDRHEACAGPSDCGNDQACFKGFCVRSDEAAEHALSEQVGPDSGTRAAPSMTRDENRADASAGSSGRSSTAPRASDASAPSNHAKEPAAGGSAPASSDGSGSPAPGGSSSDGDAAVSGTSSSAMPAACQPRAEECNGADEDCDGEIDEYTDTDCYPDGQAGCTQAAGGRWSCTGTCATGKRACVAGKLQSCAEYKAPSPEACTELGMQAADEDCNGKTDETCACSSGAVSSCYDGRVGTRDVGKCKSGTQTCNDGRLGACTGQVPPGAEDCSNMNSDDDCDGVMDNVRGLGSNCVASGAAGSCSRGKLQCATGAEPSCVAEAPKPETCNGLDDDCNGKIDDGLNLKRDQNNCGECGHKCTADEVCRQGECTTQKMEPSDPPPSDPPPPTDPKGCSPACGAGQACCGSSCVDVGSDINNCGMCGNACAGATKPGCCGGKCVDLVSEQNCGRCGRDCSLLSNGGITCSCRMNGDGEIACTGPVLNLCL